MVTYTRLLRKGKHRTDGCRFSLIRIDDSGMSPSEVECCFKQILYGVEYLHSQGVAHRDIKPENLFFDVKGHLKVRW